MYKDSHQATGIEKLFTNLKPYRWVSGLHGMWRQCGAIIHVEHVQKSLLDPAPHALLDSVPKILWDRVP